MSAKESYIQFIQSGIYVPLFFTTEWLNAYAEDWQVLETKKGKHHVYFVFFEERKLGFQFIRNPQFTPYHGFLSTPNIPEEQFVEMAQHLLHQLPKYDELYLDCLPGYNLPSLGRWNIRWKRTNILTLDKPEFLFKHFKSSLQRQIRKGERNLTVKTEAHPQTFSALYSLSLQQRGVKIHASQDILESHITRAYQQGHGKTWYAEDCDGKLHAVLFVVWDNQSAYYLAGGTDKSFNGSGAMSLLLWHAIQYAEQCGKQFFDFEGSEEDSIHRFFQNFNPKLVHYLHIQSQPSTMIKWLRKWQQSEKK